VVGRTEKKKNNMLSMDDERFVMSWQMVELNLKTKKCRNGDCYPTPREHGEIKTSLSLLL
jgi:hypothetical protein